METKKLYGFAELSAVTGMSTSTLSTLLHRSRVNRDAGKGTANDIPEPDAMFGMSPAWAEATVRTWLEARAVSPRVKRAVDPERSLKEGRAVPLKADNVAVARGADNTAHSEPAPPAGDEEPDTLRGRIRSLVKARRRTHKEKS